MSMNVVFKEAKEQLILEAKPRVINLFRKVMADVIRKPT